MQTNLRCPSCEKGKLLQTTIRRYDYSAQCGKNNVILSDLVKEFRCRRKSCRYKYYHIPRVGKIWDLIALRAIHNFRIQADGEAFLGRWIKYRVMPEVQSREFGEFVITPELLRRTNTHKMMKQIAQKFLLSAESDLNVDL